MTLQVLRPAFCWVLFLSAIVAAQSPEITSVASSSAEATSSASFSSQPAQTHTVSVGKADHKFDPDIIRAQVGDIINFQFFPPNHSVARAPYEHPCVPYELFGVDQVGFFSGFYPVDVILDNPPSWKLRINDTDPIFFYCAAEGSCINYAMVGVINPNSSVSLAQQKSDAKNSDFMVVPGNPLPDSEASPTATTSLSGSSSISSSTASSTATDTPTSSSTPAPVTTTNANSHHLSTGAIAGIAVGGVIAIAILCILIFLLGRNTALLQAMKKSNHTSYSTGPTPSQGYDARYAPPYSPDPVRYSSPAPSMGESKMYGPASTHHQPAPLAVVAELSSPQTDYPKTSSVYPDGQVDDDDRRQTITPPPSNRHSKYEGAPQTKNQPTWATRPIPEGR